MGMQKDSMNRVLYYPSTSSSDNEKCTVREFKDRIRETFLSTEDEWFTYDGGSPVILLYLTGVGGKPSHTNDPG